MATNTYQSIKNKSTIFVCSSCDYKCSKQSVWNKHCLTAKHKNTYHDLPDTYKKVSKTYNCKCGKTFVTHSGLWKHAKKCVDKIVTEKASKSKKQENNINSTTNKTSSKNSN